MLKYGLPPFHGEAAKLSVTIYPVIKKIIVTFVSLCNVFKSYLWKHLLLEFLWDETCAI